MLEQESMLVDPVKVAPGPLCVFHHRFDIYRYFSVYIL
jgi:hypothetical protein